MNSRTADPPIVALSVTIYRSLLVAYPARFRREYGLQMLQVFRDCCLRASQEDGTRAMTRFWAIALLDLTRSAIQQHLRKEAYMSRSQFIRIGGVALMLSSLAYVIPDITLTAWLIGSLLLVLGIFGLRLRYGPAAGPFARTVLLAGVIAMFLAYALMAVLYVGQTYLGWMRFAGTSMFHPERLWIFLFAGPFFPMLSLTLFGVAALHSKPMPHLNWLPLATGVWFPATFGAIAPYIFTHAGAFPDQYWNLIQPLLLMQFLTLVLLGAVLVYDKLPEMAPA